MIDTRVLRECMLQQIRSVNKYWIYLTNGIAIIDLLLPFSCDSSCSTVLLEDNVENV